MSERTIEKIWDRRKANAAADYNKFDCGTHDLDEHRVRINSPK